MRDQPAVAAPARARSERAPDGVPVPRDYRARPAGAIRRRPQLRGSGRLQALPVHLGQGLLSAGGRFCAPNLLTVRYCPPHMSKRLLLFLLTVLLLLVGTALAACGDDDDDDGGGGGTDTTAADFDTLESGTLTVGSDIPYAPFEFGD